MPIIRICKNLSNFPFLPKCYKARTVCWCKQPTSNSFKHFELYVLTQIAQYINYYIAGKCLANICSEINKIQLILWMVYTCNVKGLEEVKKLGRNECTLHRWPRSPMMNDWSRPYRYIKSHLADIKPTTYGLP